MSCCVSEMAQLNFEGPGVIHQASEEALLASRPIGNGLRQTDLSVPGVHCAGCIRTVENGLSALPGVVHARLNLSTRRVAIQWDDSRPPPPAIERLKELGYDAVTFSLDDGKQDHAFSALVRATAVAGFSAGNVMLLSVAVWSGAEPATREVFHWISAAIALPTLVYSGQVFYRSAWQAFRHRRLNMDVPITLGIGLAYLLSLYETVTGGTHAYFDAAVTLIFFLLVGRTLDHLMRARARVAVEGLARMVPRGASVLGDDGGQRYIPLSEIAPGMRLMIPAGARVPVDVQVEIGSSDVDRSVVTGESRPQPTGPGATLQAGTLNLTGPLTVLARSGAETSFLSDMIRMMEQAETGRLRYRRIADRVSGYYAPVVHLAALLTFAAWMWASGDIHQAITTAVAVLIITCPCALGLAVPIVQVMAARRLFEAGIMVKDGTALEKLEQIDTVVFDKTGTLTEPATRPSNLATIDPAIVQLAARLAAGSTHPLSRALALLHENNTLDTVALEQVIEHPGLGVSAVSKAGEYRLGRADWALCGATGQGQHLDGTVLSLNGKLLAAFCFDEALRPGAAAAVRRLLDRNMVVEMVSGDTAERAKAIGSALGIAAIRSSTDPHGKVERLRNLDAAGHRALMVGDGLNDAPALTAAHVSMAPSTAADIGRNAADFVFLRGDLSAVPYALDIAARAGRLLRQNLALAIGYNMIAVPIAMLGYATPLIAAVAMSTSSILVIGNALRLRASAGKVERLDVPQGALGHG
ncbi:heavy metal translocating P-type ATPase [Thalassobaculum sp.]|uniref:heavy metal translocating P-type ATPase n=1 Tax=Thalassobaculum sp. TaxID=2022740 RepID=UPI0032EDD5FB